MSEGENTLGKDKAAGVVDTQVGSNEGFGISMMDPREIDPKAKPLDPAGYTADLDTGKVRHGDEDLTGDDEPDPEDGGEDGAGEEPPKQEDKPAGDLPDFEDKPEVIAKYDAKFITDGALNMEALSENFWSNVKRDDKGQPLAELPAGTMAYLKSKGLSDAMIRSGVEGQLALAEKTTTAIYTRAGGKDKLEAALKWAREGGYDEAGRKRFNAILASNDQSAMADAVDLLMTRHEKASGQPPAKPSPKPGKTTSNTTSTTATGVQGFATRDEWSAAFKEANDAKDRKKLDEVRRRLAVSKWYTG